MMGRTRFPRPKLAGTLLAALLGALAPQWESRPAPAPDLTSVGREVFASGTASEAGAAVNFRLAPPKPAPAHRKELPAAFTKAVPKSMADLQAIEQQVKNLVTRVSPAVVAVEVGSGSGSGVIISADGLVLTAGHVCERPNRDVRFTFPNGKNARGKTLGLDADHDTGLMRITDPGPWPCVPPGDLDEAAPGDWVLALGHPGGFDLKRSLVVRLGRIVRLAPDALQTDCTISPGDSGGPLFDMHGRVIGVHSAISRSLADNFHVAITEFYQTWAELAKGVGVNGRPGEPRAYVGARAVDDAAGCRISAIDQDSPAFKAGLKVGYLVLKIDGREISAAAAFRRWVGEAQSGQTLDLDIQRGEQALSVAIKLEPQPPHH